jgi:DNA-binding transcriptional MerR regulator
MVYTVKQLSKIAGISARTLHYYDEIGLLKPSFVQENGYRCYTDKELIKLQQILFFRELEFSLVDIKEMINSPEFNENEALAEQKKLLKIKRARLDKLIETIDKTIKKLKGGEDMNNDDLFASFGDDELVENMKEAKRRWGDSEAFKQSIERTKHWTKKDYERIKKEGREFTEKLSQSMDKDIASPEVQALVREHHKGIEYFYDCSYEMYRNLGKLYVDDPRFTAYYDKVKPGLAAWLQKAINYYCDAGEKK